MGGGRLSTAPISVCSAQLIMCIFCFSSSFEEFMSENWAFSQVYSDLARPFPPPSPQGVSCEAKGKETNPEGKQDEKWVKIHIYLHGSRASSVLC